MSLKILIYLYLFIIIYTTCVWVPTEIGMVWERFPGTRITGGWLWTAQHWVLRTTFWFSGRWENTLSFGVLSAPLILAVWDTSKTDVHSDCANLHLSQHWIESPHYHKLSPAFVVICFLVMTVLTAEVESHSSFNLDFPWWLMMSNIIKCLLFIYIWELFVLVHSPVFDWAVCFPAG